MVGKAQKISRVNASNWGTVDDIAAVARGKMHLRQR